jgi:hypothetical protein
MNSFASRTLLAVSRSLRSQAGAAAAVAYAQERPLAGTYFLVGAYLGWYEVINVGQPTRRLWAPPSAGVSHSGYWGSLSYLVGAVAFEVAVVVPVVAPHAAHAQIVQILAEWMPQAVGGAFFSLAAVIEVAHNYDIRWRPELRVWWLCFYYLVGSLLFWSAASVGFALSLGWLSGSEAAKESATKWAVDLPYLLGSVAFLAGAWMQMRMWKAQQFGLGFIREVNVICTTAGPRTRAFPMRC